MPIVTFAPGTVVPKKHLDTAVDAAIENFTHTCENILRGYHLPPINSALYNAMNALFIACCSEFSTEVGRVVATGIDIPHRVYVCVYIYTYSFEQKLLALICQECTPRQAQEVTPVVTPRVAYPGTKWLDLATPPVFSTQPPPVAGVCPDMRSIDQAKENTNTARGFGRHTRD